MISIQKLMCIGNSNGTQLAGSRDGNDSYPIKSSQRRPHNLAVERGRDYELRECRMPAVKVSSRCANVSSKCREA